MKTPEEDRTPARVITVDRDTIDEVWYCGNCRKLLKLKWQQCPKCGKSLLWEGR